MICYTLILNQWRRTNLKVGAPVRRKAPGKFFLVVPLHFFGSKSTIRPSRFGERFRDGQSSLVSFLFAFLLLTVLPLFPAICKSGGTCPPCPMEPAPLF